MIWYNPTPMYFRLDANESNRFIKNTFVYTFNYFLILF